MSCDRVDRRLEELAAGRLLGAARRAAERHLESCARCRQQLRLARRLAREVAALPRRSEPRRDLWPGVTRRLGPAGPGRRDAMVGGRGPGSAWRLAAGLAVVSAGLVAGWLAGRPAAGPVAVAEPPAAAEAPAAAAASARHEAGMDHAYRDLVVAAAERRDRLDESGTAALEAGLAELERAVAEVGEAATFSPGNLRLELLLAAALRRESEWASRLRQL